MVKVRTEYVRAEGYGPPDGAEAEDLRREFEGLIATTIDSGKPITIMMLTEILDRVAARDSLRFLERHDRRFDSVRARVNRLRVTLRCVLAAGDHTARTLAADAMAVDDRARRRLQ